MSFLRDGKKYLPRFGAHKYWSTCVRCQESRWPGRIQKCECNCCVYCSATCKNRDREAHAKHCSVIGQLSREISAKMNVLLKLSRGERSHINEVFHRHAFDLFNMERAGLRVDKLEREKKCYLDLCENLIKELIREGCRQMGQTNRPVTGCKNELAFRIALDQSVNFLSYKPDYPFLAQHIYLLAGRLQEAYDLSCYLASKGRTLDDETITVLRGHISRPTAGYIRHHDCAKSFFRHGTESGRLFVKYLPGHNDCYCSTNWTALAHMFLLKYFLHMNKVNLATIDEHFLNDTDCTDLIGQFMGMKREWIASDRNYFRDQAFEIVHLFYIDERYFGGLYFDPCIGEIKEFAEECYPEDIKNLITFAFDMARARIDYMGRHHVETKVMSPSRWDAVIKSYEHDHKLIYATTVRPYLPWIVWNINEIAGCDVIGMNIDAQLGVARLVTETEKSLSNSLCGMFSSWLYRNDGDEMVDCDDFQSFFTFDNWQDMLRNDQKDFQSFCPMGGNDTPDDMASFYGIVLCLMIETKIAQCHFNKVSKSNQAVEILAQVPDYWSNSQSQSETDFVVDGGNAVVRLDSMACASECIPVVTKTVQALFDAGIATEKNLAVLFRQSSFVSYLIQTLRQKKLEPLQPLICPFVTRRRLWKEGCVDNDMRLGLKLKYLNKQDRRERFRVMMQLGPLGQWIQTLVPSLPQFVERFGWGTLGLESEEFFQECYSSCCASEDENNTRATKKHKHELDSFLTASDACRHFFDTSSLEEAIWDFVGVPRVIALGANKQTMKKTGWKYLGLKANTLGDKSVQIGQRVVHVCSDWWTVWKEDGI